LIIIGNGLEQISVQDKGIGIPSFEYLFQSSTSKIQSFSDIESVGTLGFRGQALTALKSLSKSIVIQTKQVHESIGRQCFQTKTNQECTWVSCPNGTQITINQPFFYTPVRRQLFQKQTNICKNVNQMVSECHLLFPHVRFELKYDQNEAVIWPSCTSLKDALFHEFESDIVVFLKEFKSEMCTCWCPITLNTLAWTLSYKYFIYVNNRICNLKSNKLFSDFYKKLRDRFHTEKHPILYLKLTIPMDKIDGILF
jgi:DNA mismatch repair ATPase MutL